MIKLLEKKQSFIVLVLVFILILTILFWLLFLQLMNVTMILVSILLPTIFVFREHWKSYQKAECTREKMIRNLTLDILGFLLTMGAAMYAGGMAGGYLGLQAGIWFGLLAGFVGGFLAAWVVRSTWGKLVLARI